MNCELADRSKFSLAIIDTQSEMLYVKCNVSNVHFPLPAFPNNTLTVMKLERCVLLPFPVFPNKTSLALVSRKLYTMVNHCYAFVFVYPAP